MKSKKFLCIFLSVFMMFVFCACGTAQQSETTTLQSSSASNPELSTTSRSSEKATKSDSISPKNTTHKSSSKANKTTVATTKKETQKDNTTTAKSNKKENKTTKKAKNTTKTANTCTISIDCKTILSNLDDLDPDKKNQVPSNGIILSSRKIEFSNGESVYDVLQRVCKQNKIQMEASWTGSYNSAYIEGIHNIYELDCGYASGWMYCVNGWYPNYGCSRYKLKNGDVIKFRYSCNYGKDIGAKVQ